MMAGAFDSPEGNPCQTVPAKQSRAAKRREKRSAAKREQEKAIAYATANSVNSTRSVEFRHLSERLKNQNLCIHEVPSDGDCLYLSIAHQLRFHNIPITRYIQTPNNLSESSGNSDSFDVVYVLRQLTAQHLRQHPDEFMPFLINQTSGEPMDSNDFGIYCDAVERTSAWGGQVEVRALSNVLQVPIEIIQAEGAPVIVGEEFLEPKVTIV